MLGGRVTGGVALALDILTLACGMGLVMLLVTGAEHGPAFAALEGGHILGLVRREGQHLWRQFIRASRRLGGHWQSRRGSLRRGHGSSFIAHWQGTARRGLLDRQARLRRRPEEAELHAPHYAGPRLNMK